jgi:putative mRNA 3-end processing factor
VLLRVTDRGFYCEAGDFHIDPWRPVERAVITHAHGDHARWGSRGYLGSAEGARVLRTRLGADARIQTLNYGERLRIQDVTISLHPAGHILGSAQVRVESGGEVWVVSGDYKTEPDPTCTPFEPLRCDTFITESTFGLPIYRWPAQEEVAEEVAAWWRANAERRLASVLFGYALGKAQRLLASLRGRESGPIFCHGAVERLNLDYRESGIAFPETRYAGEVRSRADAAGALVVAPPSAAGSSWLRRFGEISTAFASGWMLVRGTRRRRGVDRGFVVSDHVDWPALLAAVDATGAERVWVTHGYREPVVRWLRATGRQAIPIASHWEGEVDDEGVEPGSEPGGAGEPATRSGGPDEADSEPREEDALDAHRKGASKARPPSPPRGKPGGGERGAEGEADE